MRIIAIMKLLFCGGIMKIGKITLDGYINYGNLLQSYALQEVLLRYSDKVDTLWHLPNNFLPETFWQRGWKEPFNYIFNKRNYRNEFQSGHYGYEMVRQGKIRDWADRYIRIRKNIKNLSALDDEYDYFVTGSDQVWNPFFYGRRNTQNIKNHFLEFASNNKRLSYAASISAPEVPDYRREVFIEGINGMHSISVREIGGGGAD